jgi:Cdc6-like AAA superfamily ATPase
MGMFENNTQDMQNPKVAVPHSEIILNELRTLSLHAKLVLCASIRLFSKDKYVKVTPMDVFTEYKKLAAKYNVDWLSAGKVTEHIKELEMLGFLKCTYPRMGQRHQIRYVLIPELDEIPRYVEILREDFGRFSS